MTGFVKMGLPHTLKFLTSTIHDFRSVKAIDLKFYRESFNIVKASCSDYGPSKLQKWKTLFANLVINIEGSTVHYIIHTLGINNK